jgi:long-chain acyl-CoA synthetase
MPLHSILQDHARAQPDHPCLQCDDEQWTYTEVDALSDRVAAGLIRSGVNRGDRVGLLFTNSPELVVCYYACFKLGVIAVPLNTRFQTPELVYALAHSQSVVLIGQPDLCAALLDQRSSLAPLTSIIVTGAPIAGATSYDELCRELDEPIQLPEVDNDDLAVLLYTSGTTARPKGVMHTHATLLRQSANYLETCGPDVYERSLVFVPLCHISGLSVLLLPTILAGGTCLIIRRFDPELVLRMLAQSRATMSGGLPVHLNMLINCPGAGDHDLSALRLFVAGGDCVPLELQNRFKALFGIPVDELCGMTEVMYSMQPHLTGERRPGSIGKPFGDVRLRLVDPQGQDVPTGEVGEIVVHSAAVTRGYWNDSHSTQDAIRNGGMHTGDLGRMDEDGFYWFAGRTKDIIIRGGSNISPGEVEDVIYTHPAVYEAAVVGVPDVEWGQRVRAYVALKPDTLATEAELIAWARRSLAAYKVPESIVFETSLPKGVTGKVLRKALRERAATDSGTTGTTSATGTTGER